MSIYFILFIFILAECTLTTKIKITGKNRDIREVVFAIAIAIERVTSENWQNVIGEEEKIWKVDDIMDEVIN